jgi:hypothetical protein
MNSHALSATRGAVFMFSRIDSVARQQDLVDLEDSHALLERHLQAPLIGTDGRLLSRPNTPRLLCQSRLAGRERLVILARHILPTGVERNDVSLLADTTHCQ